MPTKESLRRMATRMSRDALTQAMLRALLSYDAETGKFTWLVSVGPVSVGQLAGSINTDGYVVIGIGGTSFKAHWLAWLYVYGEWPVRLDHADGDKANNALGNLRPATAAQNSGNSRVFKNKKRGTYKGVSYVPSRNSPKKWNAMIAGKNLGYFLRERDAAVAYDQAARKRFGEFARVNFPKKGERSAHK